VASTKNRKKFSSAYDANSNGEKEGNVLQWVYGEGENADSLVYAGG